MLFLIIGITLVVSLFLLFRLPSIYVRGIKILSFMSALIILLASLFLLLDITYNSYFFSKNVEYSCNLFVMSFSLTLNLTTTRLLFFILINFLVYVWILLIWNYDIHFKKWICTFLLIELFLLPILSISSIHFSFHYL